ncbi:hypothetical protein XELAEV_18043475mg [Xenopus laevis]|uniref:Uncharacterized protein n=1 Tax=Xenopus laevis TaxID=8355 RepID=A0A974BWR3_XENLA|nr:hypothetical protein XELAEV_18043475mg [Xenopus laevis]
MLSINWDQLCRIIQQVQLVARDHPALCNKILPTAWDPVTVCCSWIPVARLLTCLLNFSCYQYQDKQQGLSCLKPEPTVSVPSTCFLQSPC